MRSYSFSDFSDLECPLLERSSSSEHSQNLINFLNQSTLSNNNFTDQLDSNKDFDCHITRISLSIISHYQTLLKNYHQSLQQKNFEDVTYLKKYDELLQALRNIIRESNTMDEDQLDTYGIRYSEYHNVNHQHLDQRLFETLYKSLSTLNTSIKKTTIIEDSAYLTAYYIQQYLIQLSIDHHKKIYNTHRSKQPFSDRQSEAKSIGKQHVLDCISVPDLYQWLCRTTDTEADINITSIGDIQLNSDQQTRIKDLARAFIRGKTPSLQLLKHITSPEDFRFAYQGSIQASLKDAIQDTPYSSRFYACMKSLPDLVDTSPIQSSKALTSPYSISEPRLDTISYVITAYIIKYLKCVSPDIRDDTLSDLRNTLPRDLILSKNDLHTSLKKIFKFDQISHLKILLEGLIPLASLKTPSIEELSSHLMGNLKKKYLGSSLLSKRAYDNFQTLPTAIQSLIEKPEYRRNNSTAVIPQALLESLTLTHDLPEHALHNLLTDTPIIDCLREKSEEQIPIYLNFLTTKGWITEEQMTAIQQASPLFGKHSKKETRTLTSIIQLINQMDCSNPMSPHEIRKKIDPIIRKCPGHENTISSLLHTLDSTHSNKIKAHTSHQAACKELKEFHSLAQRWIQLAKAGAQQYLNHVQPKWFRNKGKMRADEFINQLDLIDVDISDNHDAFEQLKNLLEKTLKTFNGGSLGTYILESLTGDAASATHHDNADQNESFDTVNQITNSQCEKLISTSTGTPQFKQKAGPDGQSTLLEIIQNSHMTGCLWRKTVTYQHRQSKTQHFCNQLDQLNQCRHTITAIAAA